MLRAAIEGEPCFAWTHRTRSAATLLRDRHRGGTAATRTDRGIFLSGRRRQSSRASAPGIVSPNSRDGAVRRAGSERSENRTPVSGDSPASGHFGDRYQKQGCQRAIHSLSRTASGRENYPATSALPGASKITAENLAKTCADLAANKKAEEIVILDLQGISTFTDFFVICSGTSEPHLKAIAGEIEGAAKGRSRCARGLGRWISGQPVDRARLHAGHRARLSSRETRILQPGRSLGRRATAGLGAGRRSHARFRRARYFLALGLAAGAVGRCASVPDGVAAPACAGLPAARARGVEWLPAA